MIQSDTVGKSARATEEAGSRAQLVKLGGSQSLRTAAALRGSLLQALEGQGTIAVDLDDIDDADVATLQVLIAAERSAREAGRQLRFISAADSAIGRLLLTVGWPATETFTLVSDGAEPNFQKGNLG